MDGAIPAGGRNTTRPLAPPGAIVGAGLPAPGTSRRRPEFAPSSAERSIETDALLRIAGAAGFAVGIPSARAGEATARSTANDHKLDVRRSFPLLVAFLMRFTFGPQHYYDGPRLLARMAKAVEKSSVWPLSLRPKLQQPLRPIQLIRDLERDSARYKPQAVNGGLTKGVGGTPRPS